MEDVYNLTRFGVINQVGNDAENPIFEMHDMVAESVRNIASKPDNKEYLYSIHKNSASIPIDRFINMKLNLYILLNCVNSKNFYKAKEFVNLFDEHDKSNSLISLFATDEQKGTYGLYLLGIGLYYTNIRKYSLSLQYFKKSVNILNGVKEYENRLYNNFCCLAVTYAKSGQHKQAEEYLDQIEHFNTTLIPSSDIELLSLTKAIINNTKGNYTESIKHAQEAAKIAQQHGTQPNSIVFTSNYVEQISSLNFLEKYEEAYVIKQVIQYLCSCKTRKQQCYG